MRHMYGFIDALGIYIIGLMGTGAVTKLVQSLGEGLVSFNVCVCVA